MKNSTTDMPNTAVRRRSRRRSARRPGLTCGMSCSSVATTMVAMARLSKAAPSLLAHARVDEEVGDVGEQVERDIRRRRHQHDALHDRVVAVEHRVDDQLAEAGNAEDLLGEHGAGEQLA